MLVAVMLRIPIYQAPYIHHFTYPQDILFGGFESLHSTILPKGRLRPHMVIWLTQRYRTESLFKPISLPWYMHKILLIRWLIEIIRKYRCHYNDSYTLTLTAKCSIFFVSLSNVLWKNTFKERPWKIPSVKKKCWTISSSNMLTDSLRFLLVAQI